MDEPNDDDRLFYAALAAAGLLAGLCLLGVLTHVVQQRFEVGSAPAEYAAALVHDATWLRVDILFDDVFISAYVTAAVLFAVRLAAGKIGPIHVLMIAASAAGGVLDLEENHHILAMLRLAEHGVAIPLEDILHRTDLSQLKWMLGHLAFVLAGLCVRGRDPVTRIFRATLLFWQLPLGAATWTVTDPTWLPILFWLRYLSVLGGFATIAWLNRPSRARVGVAAAGSDAPA